VNTPQFSILPIAQVHSCTDAKLDGELLGVNFILTPGDKKMAKNEIQFDIRSAEDFKVVTIEKDGVKRRELRFIVRSSAPGVAALVDNYIRHIGGHQGALKISHVKQESLDLGEKKGPSTGEDDRQATIDEALSGDRDTGCTSCNAGLPLDDFTPGKHVNGHTCNIATKMPLVPAEGKVVEGVFGGTMADRKKARAAEAEKKRALREQGAPVGAAIQ
jgi:hypothetical protein